MSGPFSASSSYTLPSVSTSKVRLFLSCVSLLALRTSFTLQRSIHLNRDDKTQRMTAAPDNCFFLSSHEPLPKCKASLSLLTLSHFHSSLPHTSTPHSLTPPLLTPSHLHSSLPHTSTSHSLTPPLLTPSHLHFSLPHTSTP